MAPFEIRDATLKELRATRLAMMSAPWIQATSVQPLEVRREASARLFDVLQAIRALESTALAEYRDRLIANEADLLAGRESLDQARKHLAQVRQLLDAVGDLLGVVARVVSFATAFA